ncbi:hypothetical protein AB4238_04335 [Shewanella sp. 10N.286.45.A1]|uniref:hypothetical protein n=1 Tax=Shewanella sp. 10N.286.45.A1 TaxID=3229694 RepID=UPI00354DDB0D
MLKILFLSLFFSFSSSFSFQASSADDFSHLLQQKIASIDASMFETIDNDKFFNHYSQRKMSYIHFPEDNYFSCGVISVPYKKTPKVLYQLTYQSSRETWTPLSNNHSVTSYWQVDF